MALAMGSAIALSGTAAAQSAPPAFAKCLACHAVGEGAQNKTGPVLNGVAGKAAGSAQGFTYSDAFQAAAAASLVWTDTNLDKYLSDPISFMPGSRMAWAVADDTERAAIIAFLKTLK